MKDWILGLLVILFIVGVFVFRKRLRRFFNLLMSKYQYFTFSEFDSPDEPGSGEKHMSREVIRRLDAARGLTKSKEFPEGVAFVILSGYRTPSHNSSVGGVANSTHLSGLGVDIDYNTEAEKIAILKALRKMDFKRFGIRTGASGSSIHVDIDEGKSQYVVWGYDGVDPTPNPFTLA